MNKNIKNYSIKELYLLSIKIKKKFIFLFFSKNGLYYSSLMYKNFKYGFNDSINKLFFCINFRKDSEIYNIYTFRSYLSLKEINQTFNIKTLNKNKLKLITKILKKLKPYRQYIINRKVKQKNNYKSYKLKLKKFKFNNKTNMLIFFNLFLFFEVLKEFFYYGKLTYRKHDDNNLCTFYKNNSNLWRKDILSIIINNKELFFDISRIPDSHIKIYKILIKNKKIPISYGEIAQIYKNNNYSRFIGYVMKKNPFPPFIPCHRVIGKSNKLIGYSGSGGILTKKLFLNFEIYYRDKFLFKGDLNG